MYQILVKSSTCQGQVQACIAGLRLPVSAVVFKFAFPRHRCQFTVIGAVIGSTVFCMQWLLWSLHTGKRRKIQSFLILYNTQLYQVHIISSQYCACINTDQFYLGVEKCSNCFFLMLMSPSNTVLREPLSFLLVQLNSTP